MPFLPKFASSMKSTAETNNGVAVGWTNHRQ